MSNSADTGRATRFRLHPTAAALAFAVVALIACDTGSKIIGTVATVSSDASLRALQVTPGSLIPAFDTATTSYSTLAPFTTASITVTPTATNSFATIAVNGTAVASGSPSSTIPIGTGTTLLIVVVTAADTTTTRTYTITVVRASS